MTLDELPAMVVERIESEGARTRIHGRFDRLDGVRPGGCFRLKRGEYAWTELTVLDRTACTVSFTDERDPAVVTLTLGGRYVWLDDYWQMPLVEAIADPSHRWRRISFVASDAQMYRQGDCTVYRQVGHPLPEGVEDRGIKPGGWDHEHCGLCDAHIDADSPVGYVDDDDQYLCEPCYSKYGATHDLSFEVGG